jgi:hypothetical protein
LQAREKRATINVARLPVPFWDIPQKGIGTGHCFFEVGCRL